jgi:hypothetical protein
MFSSVAVRVAGRAVPAAEPTSGSPPLMMMPRTREVRSIQTGGRSLAWAVRVNSSTRQVWDAAGVPGLLVTARMNPVTGAVNVVDAYSVHTPTPGVLLICEADTNTSLGSNQKTASTMVSPPAAARTQPCSVIGVPATTAIRSDRACGTAVMPSGVIRIDWLPWWAWALEASMVAPLTPSQPVVLVGASKYGLAFSVTAPALGYCAYSSR